MPLIKRTSLAVISPLIRASRSCAMMNSPVLVGLFQAAVSV
ncbi:hypothetical protein HMPREF9371_0311 [Neisseria shayeganii 871]|uniref:Uncharacterized protein n=1 Tax=Neisseria shayeganii 871 TaxID=1032488 RepID=G4CFC2_9NEIS|nr:hypothetical protein HMPREF9371_0311 [Neisseria shayeganii 871]